MLFYLSCSARQVILWQSHSYIHFGSDMSCGRDIHLRWVAVVGRGYFTAGASPPPYKHNPAKQDFITQWFHLNVVKISSQSDFILNCEHSEQYNWRSQYNCRRQYNFLLARNITAKPCALQKKKRPLGSLCSFVVLIMLQRLRQRGNHLHMRHSRYIRLRW